MRRELIFALGVFLAGGIAWAALTQDIPAEGNGRAVSQRRIPAAEAFRGTMERLSIAPASRPTRVLAHYGFGEDGYRPFAVLDFGPTVGAVLPGTVVSAGDGAAVVKSPDGTVLTYGNLGRVLVCLEETVDTGDVIGTAAGPVILQAERSGRAFDPVAAFWPELSRFAAEAKVVEKERKRLAERVKKEKAGGNCSIHDPGEFESLFRVVAEETGLDVELLKAVVLVESGFNPEAVSPKGAVGLMQLAPETAKMLGVSDPSDPVQNVRAGARYLRSLLDRFGSLELALAAYNAGPGTVERHGGMPPYQETRKYVRAVLNVLARNKN